MYYLYIAAHTLKKSHIHYRPDKNICRNPLWSMMECPISKYWSSHTCLEDSENMRLSQVAFSGTCGKVEPLHWPSHQAFCLCPQLEKAFKAVALIFSIIAAVSKFWRGIFCLFKCFAQPICIFIVAILYFNHDKNVNMMEVVDYFILSKTNWDG